MPKNTTRVRFPFQLTRDRLLTSGRQHVKELALANNTLLLEELMLTIARRNGGMFVLPPRITGDVNHGFVTLIGPQSRFNVAKGKWVEFHELRGFADQTRELFYATTNGICYAGTFRASSVTQYSLQGYRDLSENVSYASHSTLLSLTYYFS